MLVCLYLEFFTYGLTFFDNGIKSGLCFKETTTNCYNIISKRANTQATKNNLNNKANT